MGETDQTWEGEHDKQATEIEKENGGRREIGSCGGRSYGIHEVFAHLPKKIIKFLANVISALRERLPELVMNEKSNVKLKRL